MIKFQPQKNNNGEWVTTFYKLDQSTYNPMQTASIGCPTCLLRTIKPAPDKVVGKCSACGHIHSFFTPFPSQELVRQLGHRIIASFGGTGSAKTTGSSSIATDLIRFETGVKIYAMAQTEDQLKKTGKEELAKFFFEDEWVVKNELTWTHRNGSVITWYTSNDEQKIRGVNAGYIWLIEASGINEDIFKQSQARVRQNSMKVYAKDEEGNVINEFNEKTNRWEPKLLRDKVGILLETNPSFGWVRDQVLFKSHTIIYTANVRGMETVKKLSKPQIDPEDPNKVLDLVSVMTSSLDNPTMTADYLATIRMTYSSVEEYERDLYCNMAFAQGMVFGDYFDQMKLPYKQQHDYKVDGIKTFWVEGIDPGGAKEGNDHTAYILATYEEQGGGKPPIIIPRYTIKKSGLLIDETAALIWQIRNKAGWNQRNAKYFVCDPSGKRENWNLNSYKKDLAKYDLYVNTDVNNDINYGIKREYTFIRSDALKIPSHLEDLWDEIKAYRWDPKLVSMSKSTGIKEIKPKGGKDHLLDVMRYIVVKAQYNGFNSDTSVLPFNNAEDVRKENAWLQGELNSLNPFAIGNEKPVTTTSKGGVIIRR